MSFQMDELSDMGVEVNVEVKGIFTVTISSTAVISSMKMMTFTIMITKFIYTMGSNRGSDCHRGNDDGYDHIVELMVEVIIIVEVIMEVIIMVELIMAVIIIVEVFMAAIVFVKAIVTVIHC